MGAAAVTSTTHWHDGASHNRADRAVLPASSDRRREPGGRPYRQVGCACIMGRRSRSGMALTASG